MANLSNFFAAVRDGRWVLGLGDPDAGAFVVTGLYLMTSIACLLAARQLSRYRPRLSLFEPRRFITSILCLDSEWQV